MWQRSSSARPRPERVPTGMRNIWSSPIRRQRRRPIQYRSQIEIAVRQDEGPVHCVAQLPHIAWPGVVAAGMQANHREKRFGCALLRIQHVQKILREQLHIVAALAQRWHEDRADINCSSSSGDSARASASPVRYLLVRSRSTRQRTSISRQPPTRSMRARLESAQQLAAASRPTATRCLPATAFRRLRARDIRVVHRAASTLRYPSGLASKQF